MLGGRITWVHLSRHFCYLQHRRFCNNNPTSLNKQPQISNGNSSYSNDAVGGPNGIRNLEAYRDLDKLDFMKAAKILFSDSPNKKKFGLDFHLVQLFFALMPSLAVYLVAQYARHDIKKMEAELEEKRKAEEKEKAKEKEKLAKEEKEQGSDQELVKVMERLEALEETVNEIAVETKKQPSDKKGRVTDQNQGKEDFKSQSDDNHGVVQKESKPLEATPVSPQRQKHNDTEKRGSH